MSLVYMHKTPNNKYYIGITTCEDPNGRWKYGKGYKTQSYFWKAIVKYGWDNIEHTVIAENLTLDEACKMEIELIDKYQSNNPEFGYNCCPGGNTNAGYHHTEEAKKRMSEAKKGKTPPNKGKHLSEEQKERLRQVNLGKKQSKETIERRRQKLLGHTVSEETRRKISNGHKGKHLSEETRKKLSEINKGKPSPRKGKTFKLSEDAVEKIRQANLGKPKSEETKRKLSESLKGIRRGPMSEEHKQKIREAQLRRRTLLHEVDYAVE